MNKKFLHLFIFMLAMFFSRDALANTDILCNILSTCNGFLKEAGEVQNKISGKVRKILSLKVSPAALLEKVGAGGLMDKAQKLKEKAENLKEKAEKIKAFAENAKEKKDELLKKYNELNNMAKEKFDQAKELFDKAEQLKNEYLVKIQDGVEKVKDGVEKVKDGVDKVKGGIETVKDNVEKVKGGKDVVENKARSDENNEIPDVIRSYAEGSPVLDNKVNQTMIPSAVTKEVIVSETSVNRVGSIASMPIKNRAATMSEIIKMTDKISEQNAAELTVPDTDILKESEIKLKPVDILNNAASLSVGKEDLIEGKLKSDIDMVDQISANFDKKVIKDQKAELKPSTLLKDDGGNNEIRKKFDDSKLLKADIAKKDDVIKSEKAVELKNNLKETVDTVAEPKVDAVIKPKTEESIKLKADAVVKPKVEAVAKPKVEEIAKPKANTTLNTKLNNAKEVKTVTTKEKLNVK